MTFCFRLDAPILRKGPLAKLEHSRGCLKSMTCASCYGGRGNWKERTREIQRSRRHSTTLRIYVSNIQHGVGMGFNISDTQDGVGMGICVAVPCRVCVGSTQLTAKQLALNRIWASFTVLGLVFSHLSFQVTLRLNLIK